MTLLAVAQVVADTLTGSNPVLTPVTSGEPEMNFMGYGLQRWMDYDCTGSDVCHSLLYLF